MKRTKYTKELLEPIVKESESWCAVLYKLDLKKTGGNHRHIQTIIRFLEIDTSHFTGQLWSKGKTKETHISLKAQSETTKIPDSEIFVKNSRPINGTRIKDRLLSLGWDYLCNKCGINSWQDKPLTLHLDHINGIHNDNRFENLRFLCPNCHQQTDTWGNKGGIKNPSVK